MQELIDRAARGAGRVRPRARGAEPPRDAGPALPVRPFGGGGPSRIPSWPRPRCSCSGPTRRRCWWRASTRPRFPASRAGVQYRSYDYEKRADPAGELTRLSATGGRRPQRSASRPSSLPTAVAGVLRAAGGVLVAVDDSSWRRGIKLPVELDAIRRGPTSPTSPRPRQGARPAGHERGRGRRARAGPDGDARPAVACRDPHRHDRRGDLHRWLGGDVRIIAPGDLVLCDTSPWIDGHWSDSANAVCAARRAPSSAASRPPSAGAGARHRALHAGVRWRATSTLALRDRARRSRPTYGTTPATGSAPRGRSRLASRPTSGSASRRAWSWPSSRRSTPRASAASASSTCSWCARRQ